MSLDDGYVTSDYLKTMAERFRALKALSYEHMAISEGNTLLDVGCGPGVDTVPLAGLCGEKGCVIGIDSDAAMLAEADSAAAASPWAERIEHRQGEATALPLAESSADACRAERLLQVLPPEQASPVVAELLRVTRPGGRIVLVDTDWGSASIDFSDATLERKLMGFFALQMRPHGMAGRRLPLLCREHGLEALRLDVVPMVQLALADTPFGDWLPDTALAEGVINQEEAQGWREELAERDARQRFHACVNMVIASGRRP